MSRAYTHDEVVSIIIDHSRMMAKYWANLPDKTPLERCEGVAFSILTLLDGSTMSLPGVDLILRPHESDKEYHIENGENYFEPDMIISTALHEFFHK